MKRCALFKSVCDLKVKQMNVKRSLIQKHPLSELELGHKAAAAFKKWL